MFPRKYNKQSKIKRFFLKILNIYAIDKETLNSLSSGVIVAGKNAVQVVLGTEVEFVADAMKARV